MQRSLLVVPILVSLAFTLLVEAQENQALEKQVSAMTPATVGQEMFRAYCASCHGADAKGKGPAASELKKAPPDLTLLSKKNDGKFPAAVVASVIQGTDFITDHGSRDMPIWGEAFRANNRDEAMVKLKIQNLVVYMESIQQK